MKKTKLLTLGLASVAIAGIVGAGIGLNHQMKADEAKADGPNLYLDTTLRNTKVTDSSNWTVAGAKFAVHYWDEGEVTGKWTGFMTDANSDGIYEITLPSCDYFILVRLNSDTVSPNWDKTWNQTEDIPFDANYNLYAITSMSDGPGGKSTYIKSVYGDASLTLDETPHEMDRDSVLQYSVKNLSVSAGDTFSFTVADSPIVFSPEAATNNNYGPNGIRFGGNVDVYLKWDGSAYSIWVSGMPEPENKTTYLYRVGKAAVAMSEDNDEYSVTHLDLSVGDNISFQYAYGDVYGEEYHAASLEGDSEAIKHFTFVANTSLVVATAGTFDLYIKDSVLKVYYSYKSDAYIFAEDFNDKVGTECGKIEASKEDNLVSIWGTMKTAYLALPYEESRTALKTAVADPASEDALKVFAAKYDQVYNKYLGSAKVLEDFVGRHSSAITSFNVAPATNDNTPTIFFIALGAAGVVIGGCSYIALRKRKED